MSEQKRISFETEIGRHDPHDWIKMQYPIGKRVTLCFHDPDGTNNYVDAIIEDVTVQALPVTRDEWVEAGYDAADWHKGKTLDQLSIRYASTTNPTSAISFVDIDV